MKKLVLVAFTALLTACSSPSPDPEANSGAASGSGGSSSSSSSSGEGGAGGGSTNVCIPDGIDPYSCGCVGHAGTPPQAWLDACQLLGPSYSPWACHFPAGFTPDVCPQVIEKSPETPFGIWCCDLSKF